MKIGSFEQLNAHDRLAMLRLLCHIDGLEALKSFNAAIRAALQEAGR